MLTWPTFEQVYPQVAQSRGPKEFGGRYPLDPLESIMSNNIAGTFDTRRDADMAVERLVQEFGIERTDIFIVAAGAENTAGVEAAGSDLASAEPSEDARDDGAHHGGVSVSVDVNDSALYDKVRSAFQEFGGAAGDQD